MTAQVAVPRTGVWMFPEAPAGELVAAIAHGEQLGLDELWLGDEGPAREPFSVLAAASQATPKRGVSLPARSENGPRESSIASVSTSRSVCGS